MQVSARAGGRAGGWGGPAAHQRRACPARTHACAAAASDAAAATATAAASADDATARAIQRQGCLAAAALLPCRHAACTLRRRRLGGLGACCISCHAAAGAQTGGAGSGACATAAAAGPAGHCRHESAGLADKLLSSPGAQSWAELPHLANDVQDRHKGNVGQAHHDDRHLRGCGRRGWARRGRGVLRPGGRGRANHLASAGATDASRARRVGRARACCCGAARPRPGLACAALTGEIFTPGLSSV
jgi:hypothetical protein